jgi:uncharacterized protein DUF2760
LNRISLAFRSFFSILFSGALPSDIAQAFGYAKALPVKSASKGPAATGTASAKAAAPTPTAPPKPQAGPADGAVQMLGVLQRDARLIDFLMEDIGPYTDAQVGAAIRDVQAQARESLTRYLRLIPVIDGVEGDFTTTGTLSSAEVKFIGNVPPDGKPSGGLLRHKGWKAQAVDLPASTPGAVIAPAELEVE